MLLKNENAKKRKLIICGLSIIVVVGLTIFVILYVNSRTKYKIRNYIRLINSNDKYEQLEGIDGLFKLGKKGEKNLQTELGLDDMELETLKSYWEFKDSISKSDLGFYSAHLNFAAEFGCEKLLEILIKMGADVNAKNYGGYTALWLATGNGHLKVVKILLENGAEINTLDNEGKTPLDIALQFGRTEVEEFLKSRNAAHGIEFK